MICYIARHVPRSLRRNRRNACPPLRYSNSASVLAGVLVTSSSANRNTILRDECIHAIVCKQNYRPRSHNNRSLVLYASSLPPEAYVSRFLSQDSLVDSSYRHTLVEKLELIYIFEYSPHSFVVKNCYSTEAALNIRGCDISTKEEVPKLESAS